MILKKQVEEIRLEIFYSQKLFFKLNPFFGSANTLAQPHHHCPLII